MLAALLSLVCGGVLLAAAAMKVAEPAASRVALGTYGTPWALWPLVAVESVLGVAVLVGVTGAAWAAAGLFAAFALTQVVVLARGGGGSPCGCLGARGVVSTASVARAALFGAVAAGAALLDALAGGAATAGGGLPWDAGGALAGGEPARILLACGVALIAAAAAALLHRAPRGALDVAGEGPELGSRMPAVPAGLVLFTADGCSLCARVKRGLSGFTELDEERDAAAWLAARVPGAPYAVVVDDEGRVTAKGTVNTAAQARSLLGQTSRRSFLNRSAGAAAALAGASTVSSMVRPGEAEAYHFCGHIYTTDSCPHPTGLPRIDRQGFPLRARDGHRVDDLGRPINREGRPLDDAGDLLRDPDGRPLPVATRTPVCTTVARQFEIPTKVDGAWYRCCKGHVRKLVDCCSPHDKRINGDASLRGYCYGNRKVFCVMFFQTKVPC